MNEKIPIEITWIKNQHGVLEPEIILDADDYFDFNTSITDAIIKFKKRYMLLIKKVQDILPRDKTQRKSSHFWKIGWLLYNFDKSTKNEFEIINFNEAIAHDFELYHTGKRRIDHLIQFGQFFSKKDILDEISFALYQELIWKAGLLKKARIFEKEKIKLLERAKEKKIIGNDRYRYYLKSLLEGKLVWDVSFVKK